MALEDARIGLCWRGCWIGSMECELIQSADGTSDRLTSKGEVPVSPNFEFKGPVVSVSSSTDQDWLGFGGAFTESAALVFWALPETEQTRLLELYFGEGGLGYTLGRSHINSCDFSPDYYSFDEVDGDFELAHFDSNVTHDTKALIPFIKAAQAVLEKSGKELKLLVTAWSPPGWMKTNGQMLGSLTPGLKDSCKSTWAKYFSKWITAYRTMGSRFGPSHPRTSQRTTGSGSPAFSPRSTSWTSSRATWDPL